jgi:hypothetical protein
MPLPKPDLCQFKLGDLVRHKAFGLGTVAGVPLNIGSSSPPDEEAVEGWLIPVRWHDAEHPASVMLDSALKSAASPETHPADHLDDCWRSLLLAWTTARRAAEDVYATYQPLPDLALFRQAQQKEEQALEAMHHFLENEARGRQ